LRNRRIIVVYLINSLGSGGAQMMLFRLLERIDREKFQPVVVSLLKVKGVLQDRIENLGVDVHALEFRSGYDFKALLRLRHLLKELSPQVLQTQLFAADILGRILGRFIRIPVIITSIRNFYYGSFGRYLLFKLTENFASRTVFISNSAAKRFTELKILPVAKAKVIYNGLNLECFYSGLCEQNKIEKRNTLELPEKGFLLLSAGRLTRQRGYSTLFRALDLI